MIAQHFWRGKRVLLTGHTGFKGGWLSLWLESMGASVAGYSLPPSTEPSFCVVAGVEKKLNARHDDIRKLSTLQNFMRTFSPEIVFHLAAQSLVRPSYLDPVDTYSTNVMGTVNVLEAVRRCPSVCSVVVITSDKCYENREWIWGYREDDPMGGYDPYSNSKGCAELVTAAFRTSFFNPADYQHHHVAVASGRAGNAIGGGDWAKDRLLPDIVRSIVSDQSVKIRDPDAVRPWQHVLEPLSGYLLLAERLFKDGAGFTGAWNFGPWDHDTVAVKEIVKEALRLWGVGEGWEADPSSHPHEAKHLKLDCTKAHLQLGWRPRLCVDTALAWTIEWYKSWLAEKDMRKLSLKQIENYMQLADGASKS